MRIPVFVSRPSKLSKDQEAKMRLITKALEHVQMEARTLGQSDYPLSLPLREVLVMGRHCAGGVILGFNQFTATAGTRWPGGKKPEFLSGDANFPTPWNHLEAGILFALGKPLLVFREDGIGGGVFDLGTSDVFLHKMPAAGALTDELREVFLKWRDRVGATYYG